MISDLCNHNKTSSNASIIFDRTYSLGEDFQRIRTHAVQVLGKYLEYPGVFTFNEADKSVIFLSERLIPIISKGRPRIMLLFSNPHPYSIYQGMFLSPNTMGRENLFWSVMRESGWINIPEMNLKPKQLAEICLNVLYKGPFELIFYCYYAFPTNFPEDISKIFGKEYFKQFIEPEASTEFRETIQETNIKAIVAFNKGIFNLVSKDPVKLYTQRLMKGEHIRSDMNSIDRDVPIFLTYPTGWRYHEQFKQLRKDNLTVIRTTICQEILRW